MHGSPPETEVVGRHLDQERNEAHGRDRRKCLLLSDPRTHQRVQQPRDAEDERQDAETERERCEVLDQRASHPGGKRVALGCDRIRAERVRQTMGHQQRGGGNRDS